MGQDPSQKPAVFWYGVIGFGIIFTCVWIITNALEAIHTFWNDLGLGWLLSNYAWGYITFLPQNTYIQTVGEYVVECALTLICIYMLGWIFSTHKSIVAIEKTVIHIPVINSITAKAKEMFELVHNIKTRPFVIMLDYPSKGYETIGVMAKKRIFEKDGVKYAKPPVLIPSSFFLPNGIIEFPEQEKVLRIKTSSSKVFTFLVMFGFTNIDKKKDKDKFEIEGMHEESRKAFIEEYYTV